MAVIWLNFWGLSSGQMCSRLDIDRLKGLGYLRHARAVGAGLFARLGRSFTGIRRSGPIADLRPALGAGAAGTFMPRPARRGSVVGDVWRLQACSWVSPAARTLKHSVYVLDLSGRLAEEAARASSRQLRLHNFLHYPCETCLAFLSQRSCAFGRIILT